MDRPSVVSPVLMQWLIAGSSAGIPARAEAANRLHEGRAAASPTN
jgi:hypothetical protein